MYVHVQLLKQCKRNTSILSPELSGAKLNMYFTTTFNTYHAVGVSRQHVQNSTQLKNKSVMSWLHLKTRWETHTNTYKHCLYWYWVTREIALEILRFFWEKNKKMFMLIFWCCNFHGRLLCVKEDESYIKNNDRLKVIHIITSRYHYPAEYWWPTFDKH